MRQIYYLLSAISLFGLTTGCEPRLPKAQLTLQVVDDNGRPVPGAKVTVVGFHATKEGKTDTSGRFSAMLRNASREVDLEAEKEGFYSVNRQTYVFGSHADGQWIPWNPIIEVQMHKIGKPIPMVVKRVHERNVPAINRVIGYDLLDGDWVEPYGKGRTPDFAIELIKPVATASNDFIKLQLTLSNPADGLVLNRLAYRNDYGLRLPATAPESGYSNRWEWQASNDGPSPNPGWNVLKNGDQDANFYFRIRTRTSEQGQIVSAIYGKIYEGLRFGSATYPERMPLSFLYYLNPDGTRNTEWDTRSNLCLNPGDVGGTP